MWNSIILRCPTTTRWIWPSSVICVYLSWIRSIWKRSFKLMEIALNHKKTDLAIKVMESAVEHNPDEPLAYYNLISVYDKCENVRAGRTGSAAVEGTICEEGQRESRILNM